MAVDVRRPIHDELITGFTALVHSDANPCFSNVEKIFIDFPTTNPSCQILATQASITKAGLDYDQRALGFSAIVYEFIESSADQSAADLKIDRLSDIEDRIFTYLEQLPNPLDGLITPSDGFVTIIRIDAQPTFYNYEQSQNGIRLYQTIDFDIVVSIQVKTVN